MDKTNLILLTNDDGINSPGLWAAAETLQTLGEVSIVAPQDQWSGAGRSMPSNLSGRIFPEHRTVHGRVWQICAVDGTPAQAVQLAMVELLPRLPDLVVAGINYGENVGSGVTISGTVGAAMEGATFGCPALAVSLQTEPHYNLSHSTNVDFSAAAFFTRQFALRLLPLPHATDVDALKVDVPEGATPASPWRLTRVSRERYYHPIKPVRASLTEAAKVGYRRFVDPARLEPDSDVSALLEHCVSVTPLSLDLTSRVAFAELAKALAADPCCLPGA
jgi:5'-nucleotidase